MNRKTIIPVTLLALLAFTTSRAVATLLVYEPFDYTQGDQIRNQTGGTGFSDAWGRSNVNAQHQVGPNLTYSNLNSLGGALTSNNRVGNSFRNLNVITPADGSTTWISFSMRVVSVPEGGFLPGDRSYLEVRPINASGDMVGDRDYVNFGVFNNLDDEKVFGIGNDLDGSATMSDEVLTIGVTYLLVASIEWNTGLDETETVSLFLNPSLTSAPLPADAIVSRKRS